MNNQAFPQKSTGNPVTSQIRKGYSKALIYNCRLWLRLRLNLCHGNAAIVSVRQLRFLRLGQRAILGLWPQPCYLNSSIMLRRESPFKVDLSFENCGILRFRDLDVIFMTVPGHGRLWCVKMNVLNAYSDQTFEEATRQNISIYIQLLNKCSFQFHIYHEQRLYQ